jgi:hypothetical protein
MFWLRFQKSPVFDPSGRPGFFAMCLEPVGLRLCRSIKKVDSCDFALLVVVADNGWVQLVVGLLTRHVVGREPQHASAEVLERVSTLRALAQPNLRGRR